MIVSRTRIKWAMLLFSVSIYIISLFLPAFLFDHDAPVRGGEILFIGLLALLLSEFAWLANPIYFIAVISYILSNGPTTKRLSITPFLLCLTSLLLGHTSIGAKKWSFSESHSALITGLGIGYYFWMLSFWILLFGSLIPPQIKPSAESNVDT